MLIASQNTHQRGLHRVALKHMIVFARYDVSLFVIFCILRTEATPMFPCSPRTFRMTMMMFVVLVGCTAAAIKSRHPLRAARITPIKKTLPHRQPEQNGEESLLPKRKENNHLDAHELPKWANWFEQMFESLIAVSAKQRKQSHRLSPLVAHIQTNTSTWANSELAESKETLTSGSTAPRPGTRSRSAAATGMGIQGVGPPRCSKCLSLREHLGTSCCW